MTQEGLAPSMLACSQCGRSFDQSNLVQISGNWVCAECKPAFLSRVMASGANASPLAWRYGGVWIRFAARFVDGLIFIVPFVIIAVVFLPGMMRTMTQSGGAPANPALGLGFLTFLLVTFLIGGGYEILMLKYRGGTVGKLACGLRVVRTDGSSLSWGVCFGRWFMWNVVTSGVPYLNSILILISAIMAGVDDQKRAIHDRVCDTRVVYKRDAA